MKSVVLSLVTYKNHDDTKVCLESIGDLNLDSLALHILVINNDPEKDFDYSLKKKERLTLEVINHKKNLGFAGGHNVSFRYAIERKAEAVMVLNNDTTLDKNLLQELIKTTVRNEKIGIVAPKIYFAKGREFHKDRYKTEDLGKVIWYAGGQIDWRNMILSHRGVDEVDHGQFDKEMETEFATGCCFLIKRSVLEKVGMFDVRYFLYLEDADLSMRVRKAGYTIIYSPQAKLWHANAGSTGGSGSALQDYFISRNRLLFGTTYAPMRAKLALLHESLTILKTGRDWQKKGVRDYYLQRFGKGRYRV